MHQTSPYLTHASHVTLTDACFTHHPIRCMLHTSTPSVACFRHRPHLMRASDVDLSDACFRAPIDAAGVNVVVVLSRCLTAPSCHLPTPGSCMLLGGSVVLLSGRCHLRTLSFYTHLYHFFPSEHSRQKVSPVRMNLATTFRPDPTNFKAPLL